MTMNDWDQELQLEFLEALQREPIIWDPKHGEHKDRKKVNDAWLRLADLMGKPVGELKSKKDSLMATYRGYCRRRAASIKSGASAEEVYKPVWFAFGLMDQFLSPVYKCGSSVNTPETNNISEIVRDDNPSSRDNEGEMEFQNEEEEQDDAVPSVSTGRRTIRRRADPPELQDAAKQMKTAFDTLNNFLNKKGDNEDECELFGKLIAKKLKKLPEDEREEVMFEIERIFYTRSFRNRQQPSNYSWHSSSHSSPITPTVHLNESSRNIQPEGGSAVGEPNSELFEVKLEMSP